MRFSPLYDALFFEMSMSRDLARDLRASGKDDLAERVEMDIKDAELAASVRDAGRISEITGKLQQSRKDLS